MLPQICLNKGVNKLTFFPQYIPTYLLAISPWISSSPSYTIPTESRDPVKGVMKKLIDKWAKKNTVFSQRLLKYLRTGFIYYYKSVSPPQ